jgi:hypothetical protein
VVVWHEVLHELKFQKNPRVVITLDFEKAYDKIQWGFLEEVLRKKGLSETWISWIRRVVQTGKVCININV